MQQIMFVCMVLAACSGSRSPGSKDPAREPAASAMAAKPATARNHRPAIALDSTELDGKAGPDIKLQRISDRIWLHLNAAELPGWGRVEANGLVVFGARGAVIIDTGFRREQTGWLLERVRAATGQDAIAMVATHSHNDRAGGVAVAAAAGVPVYASTRTKALLGAEGNAITHAFDATARLDLGDLHIELFYPGAGHAPDNIVAYVLEEHLLFGGCLVRAGDSTGMGNLDDADLPAWPATMDRVIERYGNARMVVPGHGRAGDASLLLHTKRLAEQAAN
jgi:glyoxylase-like metal-dependent hydrolase (beta-lactamase superfamily II)